MNAQSQRRAWLILCFVVVWGLSAFWMTYAQQPASQETANYTFTGKSWRIESKDLNLSSRGFEASARSDWHTHGGAQLLFVQQGRLRYQVRGQQVSEVGLHGTAYLPGGVPHWHGAVPDQDLIQVSVTFAPGIKWMEKVSDAEYSARTAR